MTEHVQAPTRAQLAYQLEERRNWGRWAASEQLGALNLVTPDRVARACSLVTRGRTVSLSRQVPTRPGPGNPKPAHHLLSTRTSSRGGGVALDYCALDIHGHTSTHIDAMCHLWDSAGMWGGRDPGDAFAGGVCTWADVEQWHAGIVTRCVLLDVPGWRGEDTIVAGGPVHGSELESILAGRNTDLGPGDAISVYGGRDIWERDHPTWMNEEVRPGLHMSCLEFLRDHDVSVLCWDFLDASPCAAEYGFPYGVHAALFSYGVALIDNCHLTDLVKLCREEDVYEFLLVIAPLRIVGGTGSPVNPIAVF